MTAAPDRTPSTGAAWWRSAVIYQVYIRSFADGNGDGLGDIAGLRSRLPYLADLGVDALWINPWYPSPMADAGYDVSDYRDVEARFGTLQDAEALLAEAHAAGLRVLLDIVPNHSSDQHPWFQEALAAGPGSEARARYLFRPGRGADGEQPPNDWQSVFGGPAWTRVTELARSPEGSAPSGTGSTSAGEEKPVPDGRPGEWYLHLFAPEQPDLDWTHPEVRADFEDTLRFWFDRGVDGFRIDVAHSLVKEEGLPDLDGRSPVPAPRPNGSEVPPHPHWDRDEVHEIYRAWRRLADSYADPRVFVAEAWVDTPERLARYVRRDELHTAFNFDFVRAPWKAAALRATIEVTMSEHAAVGAPPTWVLSNHDVAREVSRFGREQLDEPAFDADDLRGRAFDRAVGERRARAAALLMLALPGGAYVYQGEELGLPEVEDLPDDVLQDPTWTRSGHTRRGRDGCRVPVPWSGQAAPFGFSPEGTTAPPWLPQPADWAALTVEAEDADPDSMLALYRAALGLRHAQAALGDGTLRWLDAPEGALAFARDPGFACVVNVSATEVRLPDGARVLLASAPLAGDGAVGPDTAVWLATSAG